MKKDLIKYIGLELSDMRRSKDLLITEVALKTGINKDTISKYENGNSSMKVCILIALLDFYGIDLNIFFKNVYDRMHKENSLQMKT